MEKIIYFDNAATTPIAKEILEEINRLSGEHGNPSSKHLLGIRTKEKITECREEFSKFVGCKSNEIFFNSGGSEGNNTIIKGIAEKNPEKKHIIISSIEHPSILETCEYFEKKGYKIDKLTVNSEGVVNLKELKDKISSRTLIVSVMHVNNEMGTIQPIEKISKICKDKKVYFHSDMVQSLGKLDFNLKKIGLDFATFSGHKINALKGIGAIYVKKGLSIEPLIHGGHQENGLRSGTENFLGIISLAKAINLKRDKNRIKKIRDYLIKEILKIPGTKLNGSSTQRIYNNINVSFYGIEGESLMLLLSDEGICVSTGSACSSNKLSESHVLKAIGLDPLYLNGSIRITLDKTSDPEKSFFLKKLKENVKKLQKISPFKISDLTKSKEVK